MGSLSCEKPSSLSVAKITKARKQVYESEDKAFVREKQDRANLGTQCVDV